MKSKTIELISFLKAKYTQKYYNIGFAPFDNNLEAFAKLREVKWLNNPNPNKWYADPFILDYDDTTITVFVEEMDYHVARGILSELQIDRLSMNIIRRYEILKLDTHLSFPSIIRNGSEVLVLPENSRSGNSYIYTYNRETHKLINPRLLAEYPLTDAVFIDENCQYLLSTDNSNPNGNTATLYKKEGNRFEILDKYTMKGNYARNAGTPFLVCGKVIRPAQDCNGGYGKGVLFHIIELDVSGNVTFNPVNQIYPLDCMYSDGLHTFNVYKDLVVIDSYKLPNRFLKCIVSFIINIMLYIKHLIKK